jgi:hypothetical protein
VKRIKSVSDKDSVSKSTVSKRAQVVIDHIRKHGFITTEQLEKDYSYKHPPRAVRDAREGGYLLETFYVQGEGGRRIAAYRFAKGKVRSGRLQGRTVLPKKLKDDLVNVNGARCTVCLHPYEERYLQVDHRVPFGIAGDSQKSRIKDTDYMLVCGSCNRAKSWSCEHCPNWSGKKSAKVCSTCYWANPVDYVHIALRETRRLDIVWSEKEIQVYERLKSEAAAAAEPLPDYVKAVLALRDKAR